MSSVLAARTAEALDVNARIAPRGMAFSLKGGVCRRAWGSGSGPGKVGDTSVCTRMFTLPVPLVDRRRSSDERATGDL